MLVGLRALVGIEVRNLGRYQRFLQVWRDQHVVEDIGLAAVVVGVAVGGGQRLGHVVEASRAIGLVGKLLVGAVLVGGIEVAEHHDRVVGIRGAAGVEECTKLLALGDAAWLGLWATE